MMGERVRMAMVWMSRCFHSRGFGIQSPWAYAFVRYVVNEHWPYHAYEDLASDMPTESLVSQKLWRFYLRLANFRQQTPWSVVTKPGVSDAHLFAITRYIHTGCRQAQVTVCPLSPELQHADDASGLLGGMVVVEDIGRNREQRAFWKRLASDSRATVSFDLYYCGIVFYDVRVYRQQYIVNF